MRFNVSKPDWANERTAFTKYGVQMSTIALALGLSFSSAGLSAASGSMSILPSGIVPLDKGEQGDAPVAARLSLQMTPGPREGVMSIELTNNGNLPIRILRDDTPFDDAYGGDLLRILPAGKGGLHQEYAPYVGPVYRRLVIDESRFIEVAAGASLSADVNFAADYRIPADGNYRIRYAGSFHILNNDELARDSSELMNQTDIWQPSAESVELGLSASSLVSQPRAQPPQLGNCSTVQSNALVTATVDAEAFADESLQSLRSTAVASRSTSPRYTTWFGAYSEANYATVDLIYDRISSVLTNETVTYQCQPTLCSSDSVVAYVQPFLRETINLCPLFFEARLEDSYRAGTIMHELTHLLRIAGTEDLAYGPTAAATLAQSSSTDALQNADNYNYFATNDQPPLPMIDDGSTGGETVNEVPDEAAPNTGPALTSLAGGNTVRSELSEGGLDLFAVTGAVALELTSLSGDADLYVYDSADFAESALVCSSVEFSANSTLDSCLVVGEEDVFVVVHGFTNASYELAAVPQRDTGNDAVASAVELAVGQTDTGLLGSREDFLYTAIMPARIVLTSLTGEADLYVFADGDLTTESIVCSSTLTTPEESCELSSEGRVYIGVIGYAEENSYSLGIEALTPEVVAMDPPVVVDREPPEVVDAAPPEVVNTGSPVIVESTPPVSEGTNPPSDDDPVQTVAQVGSSGGGAVSFIMLLLLAITALASRTCQAGTLNKYAR